MSLKDKLMKGPDGAPAIKRKKRAHPSGWEPHVEETSTEAKVITQPTNGNPEHAQLLADSGLSPDDWHIVGDVQVRRWQQEAGGEWLRYFKFTARKGSGDTSDPEFEAACKRLMRKKPVAPKKPADFERARVVCLSDWQVGKGEGGGSVAFAERIEHLVDELGAMMKREKPDVVYLIGMGDIVEGCFGSYPSQEFTIDLDQSEQERLARRAIFAIVKAVAPHTSKVIIGAVKGNHGQVRNRDAVAFTNANDNRDVLVFESVAEIVAEVPAFSHVSFIHPGKDIAMTLDILGTVVTFVHGDEFGRGSTPQQKAVEWYKGQAAGSLPPGDAAITVWAHFHHMIAANNHGKMFFQCPSLDGGSDWYTRKTGEHARPGTFTFEITKNGLGDFGVIWSD